MSLAANRLSDDSEIIDDVRRLCVIFEHVEKLLTVAASLYRKFLQAPRLQEAIFSDCYNFYLPKMGTGSVGDKVNMPLCHGISFSLQFWTMHLGGYGKSSILSFAIWETSILALSWELTPFWYGFFYFKFGVEFDLGRHETKDSLNIGIFLKLWNGMNNKLKWIFFFILLKYEVLFWQSLVAIWEKNMRSWLKHPIHCDNLVWYSLSLSSFFRSLTQSN